jgi:nucleotide-binding universal stress UspA family protein
MKRILVAYDGGEPAQKALRAAMELARPFDAKISVVSVVPQRAGRSPTDPWDDTEVHATELLEAKKMLQDAGFDAELIEPAGDPALSIERIADAGGFDMIVIGCRGLGAIERFLQGSVSEHVATHAHQTVVVAR